MPQCQSSIIVPHVTGYLQINRQVVRAFQHVAGALFYYYSRFACRKYHLSFQKAGARDKGRRGTMPLLFRGFKCSLAVGLPIGSSDMPCSERHETILQ